MSNATYQWRNDLANIVGESGLLPSEELDQFVVDGRTPQVVVFPTEAAQVSEILRWASKSRAQVIPMGNGSKLGVGSPAKRVDVLLCTLKLKRVLEYEPANLTITVQSGILFSELQQVLAESGQQLSLDPPYASLGTLGGIVATAGSGPLRFKYGTPRDLVLGMRVTQPNGNLLKAGGKVVKNVAGYDLNKLYVGSYGTLGVITELTMRLHPVAGAFEMLLARFASVQAAIAAGHRLAASQITPTIITAATSIPHAGIDKPCLAVGFDGHPETVAWQMDQCEALCAAEGGTDLQRYRGAAREALHRSLSTFPEARWLGSAIVCKASVPAIAAAEAVSAFEEVVQASNLQACSMIHVGNGIIYGVITSEEGEPEVAESVSTLRQIRERIRALGGILIVERAPLPIRREVDVWGPMGNSFPLMRRIKDSLDPLGLLNPGRFVGGI